VIIGRLFFQLALPIKKSSKIEHGRLIAISYSKEKVYAEFLIDRWTWRTEQTTGTTP
jgi:hypothetical protein